MHATLKMSAKKKADAQLQYWRIETGGDTNLSNFNSLEAVDRSGEIQLQVIVN